MIPHAHPRHPGHRRQRRNRSRTDQSAAPAPAVRSSPSTSRRSSRAGPAGPARVHRLDHRQPLLERVLAEFEVDLVFHLAALLSTRSEFTPITAHDVNVEGTLTCSSSRSTKGSRTAGRSSSSIRPRLPPTGFRISTTKSAGRARPRGRVEHAARRCTDATSCTASTSAATTRATTSSSRPTRDAAASTSAASGFRV